MLYCERKLSDDGSCSGSLASKYSRCARAALKISGDISVARSTIPANLAMDKKSETKLCHICYYIIYYGHFKSPVDLKTISNTCWT